MNIVIDPGHGGIDDNGNYTTYPHKMYKFDNGEVAYEGVLNRAIAMEVMRHIDANPNLNGIYTVDPEDPTDMSLRSRVKVANRLSSKNTIFVSIHCNASPSHKASGFELFTTRGVTASDTLARNVILAVEPLYKKNDMPLRYDWSDGDRDKEVNFYVLRKTKCPAILIEAGFFDFEKDFNLLKDPEFQVELGRLIYEGIANYIIWSK